MSIGNNPLHLYEQAKLLAINQLGKTLIVAPHQDDESLGCGGTIALLRQAGWQVDIVFVSDGSMSHPASKKYPTESRIKLREEEAIAALQILGVPPSSIRFMRLKDSEVPGENQPGFAEAVSLFLENLKELQPDVLFIPWRHDPHKDHRASWQIVQAALANYPHPVRVLEYFIWLWERSQPADLPQPEEVDLYQVDISSVASLKQQAIMAHTSQVTKLIDDDPEGFMLSPEVLAHFSGRQELFAEMQIG